MMNMILSAALVAAMLHSPLPARFNAKASVQVGQDGQNFDACGGYGRISIKESGSRTLIAVLPNPSREGTPIDTLAHNAPVHMCDTAGDNGEWTGIVYADGKDIDCDVGSPVQAQHDYAGPCRSGWVLTKNVELIAG